MALFDLPDDDSMHQQREPVEIPQAEPCPFCHSTDSFVERMDLSSWMRVCNDCFAHGPNVCNSDWEDDEAEAEATRAWNCREKKPVKNPDQQSDGAANG